MQCKVPSVWPSERLDFIEEKRAVDVRPHGRGSVYQPMVLILQLLTARGAAKKWGGGATIPADPTFKAVRVRRSVFQGGTRTC
jgi:hypothetical protein